MGFNGEHFEGIEHTGGRLEVDFGFAGGGVGELTEEKPGILSLEVNEFVKAGVGLWSVLGHFYLV